MMKNTYLKTIINIFIGIILSSASYAQVTADFTSDVQSGCLPQTVNFTSTSTGSILTWEWDFGDGSPQGNGANVSHTYTVAGTYTVSLHCGSFNGQDDEIKPNYITVQESPTAMFTMSPDDICSGDVVSFTDISLPAPGGNIVSNQWNFNDGSSLQVGLTVNHIFNNLTTSVLNYFPQLSVTDVNGCSSTFTDTVTVAPVVVAAVSIDSVTTGGPPYTVYFGNNSMGSQDYTWDFGDPSSGVNNTSALQYPSHTFNSSGVYTVSFAVGAGQCVDQSTLIVDLITIGINNSINSENVLFYPNPVTDLITIETTSHQSNEALNIYNLQGKLVKSTNLSRGLKKSDVDVSEIPEGIYLLQLKTNNQSVNQRLQILR